MNLYIYTQAFILNLNTQMTANNMKWNTSLNKGSPMERYFALIHFLFRPQYNPP